MFVGQGWGWKRGSDSNPVILLMLGEGGLGGEWLLKILTGGHSFSLEDVGSP